MTPVNHITWSLQTSKALACSTKLLEDRRERRSQSKRWRCVRDSMLADVSKHEDFNNLYPLRRDSSNNAHRSPWRHNITIGWKWRTIIWRRGHVCEYRYDLLSVEKAIVSSPCWRLCSAVMITIVRDSDVVVPVRQRLKTLFQSFPS